MMTRSTKNKRGTMILFQIVQGIGLGLLLAVALLVLVSAPADVPLFRYQQF